MGKRPALTFSHVGIWVTQSHGECRRELKDKIAASR
jgi:hypothetical protein